MEKLGKDFKKYNLQNTIAAIGGLLTLPILHANILRLEAMAHLALANCNGQRNPTPKNFSRWFKLTGAHIGNLEDPAEDVCVMRVIFNGKNYRILEGLHDGNGHYLQIILTILEEMPDNGTFKALKRSSEAMLILSDLICAKAELVAFIEGSEHPLDSLPTKKIPTIKQLTARTTFLYQELANAGCDVRWLDNYFLLTDKQCISWSPGERSPLHRQPLIDSGLEIVSVLPSAIGPAIREMVIETCICTGNELRLRAELLRLQTKALSQNPMIRNIQVTGTKIDPHSAVVPSRLVETEPGYWIHLVLLVDDFQGFEDGGLWGESSRCNAAGTAIQAEIESAAELCKAQPGFKVGMTLFIICGYGRRIFFGFNGVEGWLVEYASDYDIEVIGWLHDFDCSELFKLSAMEKNIRSNGFVLSNLYGLISKVGISYANGGHLIQHENLPEDFNFGYIAVPTNMNYRLRITHHHRWDIKSITAPGNRTAAVRRICDSELSQYQNTHIYAAMDDATQGILRGVWVDQSRTWWIHTSCNGKTDNDFLYQIWEMQYVWMERIATSLCKALPSMPNFLIWHLTVSSWDSNSVAEVSSVTRSEIKLNISSTFDVKSLTITTQIGPAFYRDLSRSDNVAEEALIRSFVQKVIETFCQETLSVDDLLAEIVPSPDARQLHVFIPQDFRDHVRDVIGNKVVFMSRIDDAAIRIGLGWHGMEHPGGKICGKNECTTALNKIVSSVEQELCKELSKFERRAFVEAVIANNEAASSDRSRWQRTSGALIGLAHDEHSKRSEISSHLAKLNVVFITSRILVEAGLCECPYGTGETPSNIDLSWLMAMANVIFHLGGYSDAIHYGGMKPEVRISPAGQVMIDVSFFDEVVEPAGLSLASKLIDVHRNNYSSLFDLPETKTKSIDEFLPRSFQEAWKSEFGISVNDYLEAAESLGEMHIINGIGWQVVPRQELIALLDGHIQNPEAYISSLELIPRQSWMDIPSAFVEQDRQPWRFRRRLGLYRRPFLRLCSSKNSPIFVAPGILQDSIFAMMQNFFEAEIDLEMINSRKMRKWWNYVQDREAKKFEDRVCAELQRLGWMAESRKNYSEVLGRKLPENPGDIDVLAWNASGRIVVLECKNLRLARTTSEIAKQLSKYQGNVDDNGKLDDLAKHLKRVDLAQKHAEEFQRYTGIQTNSIEGALVFSTIVPMTFVRQQISKQARHLTFDQVSKYAFFEALQLRTICSVTKYH